MIELNEGHTEKLTETGEFSDSVIAFVPSDTLVEFILGQKTHELRGNGFCRVHWSFFSMLVWKENDRKERLD